VHIFDRRGKGALPIVSPCHQDDSGTLGVVLDGSIAVTICLRHPKSLGYKFEADDMVVPPLLNCGDTAYGRPSISIACVPSLSPDATGVACYTETLNKGGVYLMGTGIETDEMRTPQHQVTDNGGNCLSVAFTKYQRCTHVSSGGSSRAIVHEPEHVPIHVGTTQRCS